MNVIYFPHIEAFNCDISADVVLGGALKLESMYAETEYNKKDMLSVIAFNSTSLSLSGNDGEAIFKKMSRAACRTNLNSSHLQEVKIK